MAFALVRASANLGSAFHRVFSAAAAVAAVPSGGEALAIRRAISLPRSPLRRPLASKVDQPPGYPDEKVDEMIHEVKEFDQQFEQNLTEVLQQYKKALETDYGYFERFLTWCNIPRTKSRDNFIRCCELASVFGLSAVVGFELGHVKTSKNI